MRETSLSRSIRPNRVVRGLGWCWHSRLRKRIEGRYSSPIAQTDRMDARRSYGCHCRTRVANVPVTLSSTQVQNCCENVSQQPLGDVDDLLSHSSRADAFLLRHRRCHLHGPDAGWTHVHGGSEVSGDIPRLGRPEPITFAFIDHMVEAPYCLVTVLFHPFTFEKRSIAQSCPCPHFFSLLIIKNGTIRGHPIGSSHLSVAEFHYVEGKDFLQRRNLHLAWDKIP